MVEIQTGISTTIKIIAGILSLIPLSHPATPGGATISRDPGRTLSQAEHIAIALPHRL
jgi:hypothetical protein